jgi:hypothetical protein
MALRAALIVVILAGCGPATSLEGKVNGVRPFTVTSAVWLGADGVTLSDAPSLKQECAAQNQQSSTATQSLFFTHVGTEKDAFRQVARESEVRAGTYGQRRMVTAWYIAKSGRQFEWDGSIETLGVTDSTLTASFDIHSPDGDRLTGHFTAERCEPLPSGTPPL